MFKKLIDWIDNPQNRHKASALFAFLAMFCFWSAFSIMSGDPLFALRFVLTIVFLFGAIISVSAAMIWLKG